MQWALIKARVALADWQFRHGQYETALRLYQSVLPLDPRMSRNESVLQFMALSCVALGTGRALEEMKRLRNVLTSMY